MTLLSPRVVLPTIVKHGNSRSDVFLPHGHNHRGRGRVGTVVWALAGLALLIGVLNVASYHYHISLRSLQELEYKSELVRLCQNPALIAGSRLTPAMACQIERSTFQQHSRSLLSALRLTDARPVRTRARSAATSSRRSGMRLWRRRRSGGTSWP